MRPSKPLIGPLVEVQFHYGGLMALVTTSLGTHAAVLLVGQWRNARAGRNAYESLADALRMLIIDGRVALGTRLPAERSFAEALGVSRTTVANAYARLREDDFLESRQGSGSVTRLPSSISVRPDPDALGATIGGSELLDLRKAVLPTAPGVAEAIERALRQVPAALADSGYDLVGDAGLRSAIAARYSARGLPTSADEIMVTLGAQHAIALLARTLVRRGDRVLIEAPTYPHAREAFRAAGGRFVAVPVGIDGWDIAALTAALRRAAPSVAYVMPDLHNPTGATMSVADRMTLLREAADAGTIVIADETVGELRIEGDARPPLAAFGPAVLIGSAGKNFWGGLRIGWIRADRRLLQRLVLARSMGDLGTPTLEQVIVRELVPETAATLDHRRAHLREARDHLVGELRARFPEWQVPSPAGGLVTWVNLGRPVSSALVLAVRAEGVALASGGVFGPNGGFERFLRVPFSSGAADRELLLDALTRAWMKIGPTLERGVPSLAAVI
jgi:DNA-binding transcriptional MocR family regulator